MVSYLEVCERVVREGGAALVERLGKVDARLKSPRDLVTDADLASQKIISDLLSEALPTHEILGEEDVGQATVDLAESDFCWVIDPLDGTTNFAHNVPHFSVSLALLERGQPRVGCVFDPIRDELFSAEAGRGARLNGEPIHTSAVTRPVDGLAAIGFPPGVNADSPDLKAFLRAIPRFQAIRRTGSAALNLAYVAMGRFDATWSYSTRVWDMAAGVLLVAEAGGSVRSTSGGDLDLPSGLFFASATEPLMEEITELLTVPPLESDAASP